MFTDLCQYLQAVTLLKFKQQISRPFIATAEIFQPPVAQKDILLGDTAMSLFRAVHSNALSH